MKLQTTEKITCDWWSEHYTKSTKEHQDAICFSQTIHSHNLSGHVGYNRPVSRKKAQQRWDDPQLSVVLGDGDYEKSNPCSQQSEGVQKDAVHPVDVHHDAQQQLPHSSSNGHDGDQRDGADAADQTLGLGQILQEEKRSVRSQAIREQRHARGQEDPVLKQLCRRVQVFRVLLLLLLHKPHQRRVAHEALLIRWRLFRLPCD